MSSQISTLLLFLAGIACLALQTVDARADKRVAAFKDGNARHNAAGSTLRNPRNDAADIAGNFAISQLYGRTVLHDTRRVEFESAGGVFA